MASKFIPLFAPLHLCVRIAFFCLLALFAWSGTARAEEASVSASLSSNTTALDEPVTLEITVQGSHKSTPPQVRVDGLSIQYNGESTQIQMNNFDVTRSVKYSYTILPQKEGTFLIPTLSVDTGGKKLSTQPLKLTVSSQAGSGQADAGKRDGKLAFAEWVLPKTTAYVGEAIPVELRLYIATQIRWDMHQMPSLGGEGFTVAKTPKPAINKVTKDGREYDLAVFKTAITPVKAGKLTLPATDINTIMVLPQKRAQRPQLPSGIPDLFNDPFFNGNFATQQQVVVRPDPAELEIKPLPAEGKPKDFSGAIGQFTLDAKAAPLQVKAGDPVTITVAVKGVGSFDRMNAPTIADEPGWRVYPPSGKFQADDEVGISGIKTFEIAAIPETVQTELPRVTFSFFNPSTEKYETLAGERLALTVTNVPMASPTPPPAPALPAATPSAAAPAVTAASKPGDIEYLRVDPGVWGVGFDPVWRTRDFWVIQLIPLSALVALCGWQLRCARRNNGMARRAATLRQAKAGVFRVLRQEKTSQADFYVAAIRAIQLETALGQLTEGIEPGAVDAEAACASRPLDCETAEGIRRVFAAHDALRYAGIGTGGSPGDSLHPDQRERVLQILQQFEASHV